MSWWQSIILGIVQGLTEFIPVSSSGHLILTRELIGADIGDFLWFDLLLHIATLVAVGIVMWHEIVALFRPRFKVMGYIVIASIPLALVGFLLSDVIREVFYYSATYLWIFFLITAILLVIAEMREKRLGPKAFLLDTRSGIKRYFTAIDFSKPLDSASADDAQQAVEANALEHYDDTQSAKIKKFLPDLKFKTIIAMGLMQMAAAFPGISRSGSTIFGGVMTRGNRETIAKFSFLMSIPVILGATMLDAVALIWPSSSGAAVEPAAMGWYAYALGMIFAFLFGMLAIKFMLRLIAKADFKWFSLYLTALSIFCFFFFFLPAVT